MTGPKIENVGFSLVLPLLFEGSKEPRVQEDEKSSEPWRLGGGRGRVNPPPRRLVWRFWEVWRVWKLRTASTRLEARGLGRLEIHFESHENKRECLSNTYRRSSEHLSTRKSVGHLSKIYRSSIETLFNRSAHSAGPGEWYGTQE